MIIFSECDFHNASRAHPSELHAGKIFLALAYNSTFYNCFLGAKLKMIIYRFHINAYSYIITCVYMYIVMSFFAFITQTAGGKKKIYNVPIY